MDLYVEKVYAQNCFTTCVLCAGQKVCAHIDLRARVHVIRFWLCENRCRRFDYLLAVSRLDNLRWGSAEICGIMGRYTRGG